MKNYLLLLAVLIMQVNIITAQDTENVFTFEVGKFRVSMLSEGQQNGKTDILVGATPEIVQKYAPNGTFPNATNTFLIRTPDETILVDAGYGRKLFDNMQSLGIKAEQIGKILLTHMHGDHIGGLLRDGNVVFTNADLYLPQAEYDYWMSDEAMQAVPENRRGGFRNARNVIAAYKDKLHLFVSGKLGAETNNLFPGFRGIAAPGHTPGHTAYLIESGRSRFLIWGDLTHAMAVQMPHPEIAVTYDTDTKEAVRSRKAILEYVSKNKIPVGGMHIAYPAAGNVSKSNDGLGYKFVPLSH